MYCQIIDKLGSLSILCNWDYRHKAATRLGPEEYAGAQSPLTVEVTADSEGRIDIEIPGP